MHSNQTQSNIYVCDRCSIEHQTLAVRFVLCIIAMASSSSSGLFDSSKRRCLEQTLLAESSCSKSALARVLLKLHNQGCLVEGVVRSADARSIRRDLGEAAKALANYVTPFGCLLQSMVLNTQPPLKWVFVNPLA